MKILSKLAIAAAMCVTLPTAAQAAVVVNINQAGGNVVATLSGTLDLTGLVSRGTFQNNISIRGAPGFFGNGSVSDLVKGYGGFTGPANFGTSEDLTGASSSTGSAFAFNAGSFGSPLVFVGTNYVSGGALSGTSTYLGQSLTTLGLTAGSYVYKFGGESVTFNIASAVPEPASWALMIAGFGIVGAALRRRSAVRTSVRFA